MPPRKSKTSSRNSLVSPLKSPKSAKNGAVGSKLKNKITAEESSISTPTKAKKASKPSTPKVKETPKKETPKKAAKETPRKSIKETPKKESPKKLAKETLKNSAKETPKKSTPKKKSTKTQESKSSIVSDDILTRAIDELIKYSQKETSTTNEKDSLFDEDEDYLKNLDIIFQFKKFLSASPSLKPKLIKLSKSLNKPEVGVCLIIRDGIISTEEQLEQVENAKIPNLNKILSIKELVKEFKTFDQKRQLAKSYEIFVCDEGAITNLPALLGKAFYETSKAPIPIKIVSSSFANSKVKKISIDTTKNQIAKVLSSTKYTVPVASNLQIVGGNTLTHSPKELVSNFRNIIDHFETSKFNNGNENGISSVYLKLRNSPALPLYVSETLTLNNDDVADDKENKKVVKDDEVKDIEFVVGSNEVKTNVKLSDFEQGLLELGQFDETPEFITKKSKRLEKKRKHNDDGNNNKNKKVKKSKK